MVDGSDITICTCQYMSYDLLAKNYDLVNDINPEVNWLVMHNKPEDDRRLKKKNVRTIDIDLTFDEVVDKNDLETQEAYRISKVGKFSYHHGMTLNESVKYVDTRFALILDPDFFFVPNLNTILQHVIDKDLSFFGAPYPLWCDKRFFDFPTVFFMLIDTEKVRLKDLDFRPRSDDVNLDKDTGWRVYEKFYDSPSHKHDTVLYSNAGGGGWPRQPNKKSKDDHPNNANCKKSKATIQNTYDIQIPLKEHIDIYFWKDRLFSMHARSKPHRVAANPTNIERIKRSLKFIPDTIRKIRDHDSKRRKDIKWVTKL